MLKFNFQVIKLCLKLNFLNKNKIKKMMGIKKEEMPNEEG